MTDLEALHHAVLDRPDDDTPRLVYADALDDLGYADRAAFVRDQVEAARAAPWEPAAIRARFHGVARDAADLPALPDGLGWAARPFRRGFPARVQARDGGAFVAAADRLYALAPVESLELSAARAADVAALAACPGLARLKRLVVREGLGQAFAQVLLNSPHLDGLEELVIGAGLTSSRTARAVVGSRAFRGLRALSYSDDQPGGALIAALADLATASLRVLDIRGSRLTADALRRLVDSPVDGQLEELDIGDNHIGPNGFNAFLRDHELLPQLHRLDAMRTGPGENGFMLLLGTRTVAGLAALNLGGNALGPPSGGWDGWGWQLRNLRSLDLRDNRFGDDGVARLLARPFADLLHLDLSENGIGERGAAAILTAPSLDGLIALDLGGNPIPEPARDRLRERFGERVLL